MSKYGEVQVVEHDPSRPNGIGAVYNLVLDRPWDVVCNEFIDKNILRAAGFMINRHFVKVVQLLPGSVDVPEAEPTLPFPRLASCAPHDPPDAA